MLKRKLATLILVITITNMSVAPINVFAETIITSNVVQEEVNQSKKAKVSKIDLSNSQYNDKYNEVFKINNEKIAISNNGGQYSSSSINRAIDGNLNTHWETGKQNTSIFTNEVIFKFI